MRQRGSRGGWRAGEFIVHRLFASLVFATLCGLGACQRQPEPPPSVLSGAIEDYGRWLVQDAPEASSRIDPAMPLEPPLRQRLDQRSALAVDLRRTAALRGWVQFEAIDPEGLSPVDRERLQILRAHFGSLRAGAELPTGRFSTLYGFKPYALDPFRSAFASLPRFLSGRHPIADLPDAEDYVARLAQVAAAVRDETQRARADAAAGVVPPETLLARSAGVLQTVLSQAPADSVFVTPLRDRLQELLGPLTPPQGSEAAPPASPALVRARSLLARAEAVTRSEIYPAYGEALSLVRELSGRTGAPSADRLSVWRNASLRFVVGGAVDAAAEEAAAWARVDALSSDLDMALRSVGRIEGPVGARLAAMDGDPKLQAPSDGPGLAGLLRANATKAERMQQVWFAPTLDRKVEFRAPSGEAFAGRGMLRYEPPAAAPGAPGIIVISAESLAQLPRTELATLAFHEAVPGHHAQALYASRAQLPLALQLIHFPAFSEGWATYAEQLAEEFGLYEGDALGRVGYLRWQLIRALRLVIDAGLHEHGWTRDRALAEFRDRAGLSPVVAADEVDRMLSAPGWASAYELGRRRVAAARERARLALGAQFDIVLFHEAVLAGGEAPLDVMDARVDAWIDMRKGAVTARLQP